MQRTASFLQKEAIVLRADGFISLVYVEARVDSSSFESVALIINMEELWSAKRALAEGAGRA